MYNIKAWSPATIQNVWNKAKSIIGYDSSIYRRDACGALIQFSKHGDRNALYGWEIDHIIPAILNGPDDLINLQPLHWKNNVEKGDSRLLKCAITR